MVKYGPADSRAPFAYLRDRDSPQDTTLMARRLGPSDLRSALPVPYRELQCLENIFLKVIPQSTRKEVTQIQRT